MTTDFTLSGKAARRHYSVREFSVEHSGGHVYGQLLVPDTASAARPVPVVICSHFYGGTFRDATQWAAPIAQEGYAAAVFDFRGGGRSSRSSGTTLDMSVATELEDLLAVVAHVRGLDFVNSAMLFLEGQSLGGLVSAMAAARLGEQVRGLMLLYPAFSLPDTLHERFASLDAVPDSFPFMGIYVSRRYVADAWELDAAAIAAAYEGPAIIFHGTKDTVVPYEYAEAAAAAYPSCELRTMRGAGHGFHGLMGEQVAGELVDFVAVACGERTRAERRRESRKGRLWQGLGRRDLRKLWE